MSTRSTPTGVSTLTTVGALIVAVYVGVVAWSTGWASYDTWAALFVLPLLLLVNGALIVKVGRRDPDPRFTSLLAVAFSLKMASTVARYLMAFVLYDGASDAGVYHAEGERLAASYRDGVFDAEIGRSFVGTGFIRVATGVLYTITGPSIILAYAVFSIVGFWGLYFFYRAFRVGIPDGDHRRYSLLLLFLPSMLFWPSGLGKEAWMTLGIGLTAYGAALLFSGHRRWLAPFALGLLATGMVRPHITAALMGGFAVAYLLARRARPATELTPLVRTLGIVIIAVVAFLSSSQAASFLDMGDVSVSSVDSAIDDTAEQTDTGGSSYDNQDVNSVLDFPLAAVSVLFRPFPFEADNGQMLIAAAEGSLLLLLLLLSSSRLRSLPMRLRRQPYLMMCLVYAGVFIYAFSSFSNFGLLTRERVQVVPFVLVLFALPKKPRVKPVHHQPAIWQGAKP